MRMGLVMDGDDGRTKASAAWWWWGIDEERKNNSRAAMAEGKRVTEA
jgi:hypothetical protein